MSAVVSRPVCPPKDDKKSGVRLRSPFCGGRRQNPELRSSTPYCTTSLRTVVPCDVWMLTR